MSYTITNNIMYVRDDAGNLVPVSMIASGADQTIQAIKDTATAAESQIDTKVTNANAAIVAKTDEQAARIPEVTALAEDVSGLKDEKLDKTPGTWPAWTSAEQKAARERMGVDKEYELIETITVMDGEIRSIERTIEPNGTNYNFKVVYLHCIVPKAEQSGFMYTYINRHIHAAMQGSISDVGSTFGQAMAECKYGMIEGYGLGARDIGTSGSKTRYLTSNNVPSGYKNINSLKISSTVSIPINTVIKIWGVRA